MSPVVAAVAAATSAAAVVYPEPTLFLSNLPELPVDALSREPGGLWRSFVVKSAETGINQDLIAWGTFGAFFGACSEVALVCGHTSGFTVDMNAYGVCFAPPGTGKSLAFSQTMIDPIQSVAATLNGEVRKPRQEIQQQVHHLGAVRKKLQTKLEGLDLDDALGEGSKSTASEVRKRITARLIELDSQISDLLASVPRIKVDLQSDVTAEAMLRRAPEVERLWLASDELTDLLSGLFGHQETKRLGPLLSLFDGHISTEQLRAKDQRAAKDKGDVTLPPVLAFSKARATFWGFSQTSTAMNFGDDDGRGLPSRMLFLYRPEHSRRSSEPNHVDATPERNRYTNALALLCGLECRRDQAKMALHLDDGAAAAFKEFYDQVEDERMPGESFTSSSGLQNWAMRLPSQVLRFAGAFHLVDQIDAGEGIRLDGRIDSNQMERAIRVVRVLVRHALHVFAGFAESKEAGAARHLLERMRTAQRRGQGPAYAPGDVVNRRDVARKIHAQEDDRFKGKVGPKSLLEAAWDELVDRAVLVPSVDSGPKQLYVISKHPALLSYWFPPLTDAAPARDPSLSHQNPALSHAVPRLSRGCPIDENGEIDPSSSNPEPDSAPQNEGVSHSSKGMGGGASDAGGVSDGDDPRQTEEVPAPYVPCGYCGQRAAVRHGKRCQPCLDRFAPPRPANEVRP